MRQSTRKLLLCFLLLGSIRQFSLIGYSQSPDSAQLLIIAGKQYATTAIHQKKWGEHYRKEWSTPVKIRIAYLDTLAGGLTPYQTGGGRQSKTLRLRNASNKEYVLRSIDKTFGKALPEIAQGTFLETIANDQVSIGHPYAALTIPPLSKAAGIYHTNPVIYYIPKQKWLGQYNDEFGNTLYLFEQRPDENWEEAENFGYAKNIIGTEKLFEKLEEDNDSKVDQPAYVRARLFDMLIGDWGRHEDQWRWAKFEEDGKKIYRPIPRDRDQVFTEFDGKRVGLFLSLAGAEHLQSFDYTIKDVTTYNFPARHLDRRMTNEVTKEQWINIAKDLQEKITDAVIENAIRQMPPEVFPFSGQEIIDKLKSRRDQLSAYANGYYLFLASAVDIPTSNKMEYIEVTAKDKEYVTVSIYKIKKDGSKDKKALYTRKFAAAETKEIRIYGMEGNDKFSITKNAANPILVRIIPGKGTDSVSDHATGNFKKSVHVYDDDKNGFSLTNHTRLHLSHDTLRNNYQYRHFEYDDKGFVFRPGLTLGFGYHITKQGWRKTPFASQHRWMLYYGPNRGSLAFEYRYIANQLIGKWNLEAIARADFPFVANYFGTGNESVMIDGVTPKFYRYRSTRFSGGFDLTRLFDSAHRITFSGLFQSLHIRKDEDRFISKAVAGLPSSALEQKFYANAGIAYQFKKSNHPVVPTKGIEFNAGALYTQNIKDLKRQIATYNSSFSFYWPFLKHLSLAVRVGGATVSGDPEFYQLAVLSGKENLRGYRRQRFYGKTSFYNNNELRLVLDTRNNLFNGKIGLLAFMDQGRVWQPGEESDTWHRGYGGGFFVAPFNRILLNASYGISADDRVLHLRIGFLF